MTSSKLRGITVKPFIVALCAAFFCGPLFASNEWTGGNGDWNEPSNWSGGVPGESDEVVIAKKVTVTLTEAVKVASLTLSDSATLHVTAKPLADVSVFDPQAYATEQERRDAVAAALWANRTIVEVTGALVVNTGCTVQPENDKITGTPVVFKVGSASIAGTVNATGMGWGWDVLSENSETRPDNVPAGALAQHGGDPNIKTKWLYTYAFGSGSGDSGSYAFSPLYGGTTAYDQTYVYGYPCAPFLPGSPSQFYTQSRDMRGGGSIIIQAATSVAVSGLLEANGRRIGSTGTQSAGCTGGGVWLAAPEIVLSDAAVIAADGEMPGHGAYGRGGGGRIALTLIASEDELAALVSGEIPPGMVVSDYVNPNVAAKSPNENINGTVKWAASGYLQATLTTQSNVDGLIAAGVTWGDEVLLNGDYERTAPQYAFLADNPLIRYTCQGFVVSNKNGEVSSSDVELTASFTIDGSEGPYSLTWKWGDRQEIDPEPVSRRWVGGSSSQLMDPNNWEPAGVPTRVDELLVENAAVTASRVQVAKLVLSGGLLTLGSDAAREGFEFSVSGDVTICDGAVLNVYAPFKTDPAGYTSVADARSLLWQNRTKFSVGGAFVVADGSTVCIDNHPETGDLVVFEVGSFELAAGGMVTAAGTGFTWLPTGTKVLPTGTILKTHTAKINNVDNTPCYTYAFGCAGGGYDKGGSHTYGFDFAPFEPGSCGGTVNNSAAISRGGGSIVVLAKGAVTLAGTLNADAALNGSQAGPSGGSIWIAGATIDRGEGLVATARGQSQTHWAYAPGTGGRVAFTIDVTTEEQVAQMVGGNTLEKYIYETLSFDGLSVAGGRDGAASGTAAYVYDGQNFLSVTVTGVPLEAASPLVDYGEVHVRSGETVERTATEIGADLVNPENVRYRCTGYVVSNATSEIAADTTTNLSFKVVKGEGPYTVTWLWGVRETRTQLSETGPGTVTANGQAVGELWVADTEDVTFVATADEGKSFCRWFGSDVPDSDVWNGTFALTAAEPRVVRATFLDPSAEAKVCTFRSTANGDFYDSLNWEDGAVPNPQDEVVITGGTCVASHRFACAALMMTRGALSIDGLDEVAIPGDVQLSGTASWTITSQPTNTATAFADGATRVKIGGDLVLADTATVKPVSDPWTGGSVAFTVAGDFTLGEDAMFDAVAAGWGWVEYTGDPSPCAVDKATVGGLTLQTMAASRGQSFSIGGSYGGRGGSRPVTGWTYGFANAPIYPGSPNGIYAVDSFKCGGGLIRIHVGGLATVDGTLDASGSATTYFGGPSGGGIWLTAEKFAFGETAKLLAKGGRSAYSAQGGGGRIAIGTGLTAAQMASLIETGKCGRRAKDVELFKQDFPGVTVDVTLGVNCGGWNTDGEDGTFSYYPTPKGLLLLVK